MKILFVYLGQEDGSFLVKQREYGVVRMPKLGLQYLSSVLKTKGVSCDILDQTINYFSVDDLAKKIEVGQFSLVGFYTDTALKPIVLSWIEDLKAIMPPPPIAVGGPGSVAKTEYFNVGCDIVIHGESEVTICEIVDHLRGKRPLEEVKGISFMKHGKVIDTPPQDFIENLDTIPFPDRGGIPIKHYYNFHIFNMRTPFITMITSRGCPCNCTFCGSPQIWNRKVRQRSPENVIAEINEAVEKYKIKYISFKDDIFGLDMKWLRKFCSLLIERKYKLHWMCLVHPFSFKNCREEALDLLKRAGCDTLVMGLQSTDPLVLKNIDRDPKEPESAAELIKLAKSNGFLTALQFIFGLPGSTEESNKKDIHFAMAVRSHYVEFYALAKFDGSGIDMQYKDTQVCSLSQEEIKNWASYGMRKYYSNPAHMIQNIAYIIRHNPAWFLKGFWFLKYFIGAVGVKMKRSYRKETKIDHVYSV